MTAPGKAYVKDTISLKKNTTLLLETFFINWKKIAINIIMNDDIDATKKELNDNCVNSLKSIRLKVLITLFIMYITGIKKPNINGIRHITYMNELQYLLRE